MLIICDSIEITLPTIGRLFRMIEEKNEIPSKWKTDRIIALHKKGPTDKVENYRPISNVCSLAKVFERCVLNELNLTAENNGFDLTGSKQYGFKKGSSTTTLALELQSK